MNPFIHKARLVVAATLMVDPDERRRIPHRFDELHQLTEYFARVRRLAAQATTDGELAVTEAMFVMPRRRARGVRRKFVRA